MQPSVAVDAQPEVARVDYAAGVSSILLRAAAALAITVTATVTVAARGAAGIAVAQRTSDTSPPATTVPGNDSTGVGPGISIKEARRAHLRGPVLVVGYLLAVPGDPVRLCDALSHTRTPRCVGASLNVRGLPFGERNHLATAHRAHSATRWSPELVRILGTIHKTTLVVQTNAKA
jgi:hypothetical protein